MDSRKFKKVKQDNTPKLKHKKKKTKINYFNIIKILIIILLIFFIASTINGMIENSRLPDNASLIYPSTFNFTPYGYEFNNQLYGNCITNNSDGTSDYYYFTLEQVAALAYTSKNTFNYTSGLYINYTVDDKRNIKIVDKIVNNDKNEIVLPDDYDLEDFKENSRFIGRNSIYCTPDFGFSPNEYADSIF